MRWLTVLCLHLSMLVGAGFESCAITDMRSLRSVVWPCSNVRNRT